MVIFSVRNDTQAPQLIRPGRPPGHPTIWMFYLAKKLEFGVLCMFAVCVDVLWNVSVLTMLCGVPILIVPLQKSMCGDLPPCVRFSVQCPLPQNAVLCLCHTPLYQEFQFEHLTGAVSSPLSVRISVFAVPSCSVWGIYPHYQSSSTCISECGSPS